VFENTKTYDFLDFNENTKADVENIEKMYLVSFSDRFFVDEVEKLQKNKLYRKLSVFPWFHVGLFFREPLGDLFCWLQYLKGSFGQKCTITNTYCEDDLHTHHLFYKSKFPFWKFLYLNGLPLNSRFHRSFHKMYGHDCASKEMYLFVNFLITYDDESIDKTNLHVLKSWLGLIHPILLSKIERLDTFSTESFYFRYFFIGLCFVFFLFFCSFFYF